MSGEFWKSNDEDQVLNRDYSTRFSRSDVNESLKCLRVVLDGDCYGVKAGSRIELKYAPESVGGMYVPL